MTATDGQGLAGEPPRAEAETPEATITVPPLAAKKRFTLRRGIFLALKIAVCAGLLAWILSRADLAAVGAAMAGVSPGLLLLALAMQILGAALIALRWQGLLSVKEIRPGFPYLWQSTICSVFFRQFLPSVVGGDAIRGYDAWRAGAAPGFAVFSLVVDRLFGLLALLVFAVIAGGVLGQVSGLSQLWLWSALALLGLSAAIALIWKAPAGWRLPAKSPAKLRQVAEALSVFRGEHGRLGRAFAISLLLQINVVTFYWVVAQSLGLDLPYGAFYLIVPIAIFAMMVPLSINGIGIREAIFITLLGHWGIDEARALAFAWTEFGLLLATGLIGGLVYAFRAEGRSHA